MCLTKSSTNNTVQNQSGNQSGTQSGTSTSQATDPNVQAAYNALLSGAQNITSQPLQLYQGNLVAGLTPTQTQGINQIANASTAAAPWINAAGNYATQSATPLSVTPFNSSTLAPYMSPYTSQVVDATRALQNETNQEQQLQLQGNITAAGAWNGDRAPIAQSILARQQDLANNATLSNILQQGYQSGVNQFNTQNQLGLQAGQMNNQNAAGAAYSLGSLGTALQNAGLSGGAALLNAGGLQQAINQAQLNVPYQQYQQSLAYPYQNLSFLSSLLPGIAQGTGVGTTTSNDYSGSNYSYGTGTGKATQPFSILASGGRARLSDGGAGSMAGEGDYPGGALAPSAINLLEASSLSRAGENPVPSYGLPAVPQITSYVPSASSSGSGFSFPGGSTYAPPSGASEPMNLSMPGPQQQPQGTGLAQGAFNSAGNGFFNGLTSGQQSGSGIGGWASGLGASLGSSLFGPSAASVAAPNIAGDVAAAMPGMLSDLGSSAASFLALALKRGGRARLADGGMDDDTYDDVDSPSGTVAVPLGGASRPPQTDRVMSLAEAGQAFPDFSFADQASSGPFADPAPLADAAGIADAGGPAPTWDDGTPVGQGRPATLSDLPQQAQDNIATRMGDYQQRIIPPAYRADPTNAIVKGIGAFLGNRSIGRGIVAGMDEWEKDNHPEVDHSGQTQMLRYADGTAIDTGIPTEAALNAKAMREYRNANLEATQAYRDQMSQDRRAAIAERAQAAADANQAREDAIAARRQATADAAADRKSRIDIAREQAEAGRWSYAGVDPKSGNPILLDAKTGQTKIGAGPIAAKPSAATAPKPMTPAAAMSAAQRDYDRTYPAPRPDPMNPGMDIFGHPIQARPVPKEGMGQWLKNRQAYYLKGPSAPAAAAPAPQSGVSGPLSIPPPRPNNVPQGAKWSPSKQQWWWQQGGAWQHS